MHNVRVESATDRMASPGVTVRNIRLASAADQSTTVVASLHHVGVATATVKPFEWNPSSAWLDEANRSVDAAEAK